MNKFSVTTLFLLLNSIIFAQNIIGLWQNQNNLKIYDYYTNTSIFDFSGDYNSLNAYGFYSDCTLPSIDSLKHEKSEKHPYYFEVTPEDFKSQKKKSLIDCGELNVYREGKETIMQIYYSSRQQFVTYKKVKTIPPKIAAYLKSKGIEIPNIDESNKRLIRVSKSTLYKTPNTPTKMYLVKGNEVEVVEQKDNWLKVRYYGKKTIEGWLKKEDVE